MSYIKTEKRGIDRRTFMNNSACAAMGVTGIVNSLAHLKLMNAAMASGVGVDDNDYKALVVVFLFGAMDGNNMLVPGENHPQRLNYEQLRDNLSFPHENNGYIDAGRVNPGENGDPGNPGTPLLPISPLANPDDGGGNPLYGLHPEFADLSGTTTNPGPAQMYTAGDLAFFMNVGTLAEPFATYATHDAQALSNFQSGLYKRPPNLYAHNEQQVQMQSSVPDQAFLTGWGGRAADILNAGNNQNGTVSMNIALNGVNKLQVGTSGGVSQYIVNNTGAREFSGYGTDYANAAVLNPDGSVQSYLPTQEGHRLKAFERILGYAHENLLEDGYNEIVGRARDNEIFIGSALQEAATSGVNFNNVFTVPGGVNSEALNELKMVAQLIAGRGCIGNQRQIFFVGLGGWDHHNQLISNHRTRLRGLSHGLAAFNEAMKQLGVHDKVLTLTQSDFSRTLTPNGNNGVDHAYGNHTMMMGGPVDGGKVYGQYPSLLTGNQPNSIDTSSTRGRFIPSTSTDQYLSVAADWFGIANGSSEMGTIFPNLGRFEDPFGASPSVPLKYTL